jgi:hypothetical protein
VQTDAGGLDDRFQGALTKHGVAINGKWCMAKFYHASPAGREGEAGFREACFAPPQPAGCAKPAVEAPPGRLA